MTRLLQTVRHAVRRPGVRFTEALESIGTTFDDEASDAADTFERPPLFMSRP